MRKREGNSPDGTPRKSAFVRDAILTAACAFLLAGILRGEEREVLQKAVRICLECIGIG